MAETERDAFDRALRRPGLRGRGSWVALLVSWLFALLPVACGSETQSAPPSDEPASASGTGGAAGGSVVRGGSSGAGTSPTGGTRSSTNAGSVRCLDASTIKIGAPFCNCSSIATPSAPQTTFSGTACGYPASNQLCCADDDFPLGGDCGCRDLGAWRCEDLSAELACMCAYEFGTKPSSLTSKCDNTPKTDRKTWSCCIYANHSCWCSEDVGGSTSDAVTACKGGTKVNDCAAARATVPAPARACPAGQHEVTQCSAGPTAAGSGGSQGAADGSSGGGSSLSSCNPADCSGTSCVGGLCCVTHCVGNTCMTSCDL